MRALIPGRETDTGRPVRPATDVSSDGRAAVTTASDLTDDQLTELYAAPRRPWLRVNFVSTVDGAATGADGRSGSINNPADKRVFHLLRRLCDVVVVGAGTARAEGYKPGRTPICVVSLSGSVPETLRGAAPGRVLMATVSSARGLAEARSLLGEENVMELGADQVDLEALKSELSGRGFDDQLSEGGPHLFDGMLAAGVVDELCDTQVPLMVGGTHTRMTAGLPLDVRLSLETLLEENGTLLARWFV
ncbi:pyrimidine reductase family protein [Nocardioides sp. JQ2195]|uniref:dihydrofolate reductase family protein n=1 Tax=Nocardioides sp. JQ2195 TaxID=2592334 RepID=UPI00143EAC24|nr:dihydrofolate reductase family protein [Nocardioides sp. JQ2195]QIX25575.1 pyrimidine reductase family protein [Nocardioides sp. JQ2195]